MGRLGALAAGHLGIDRSWHYFLGRRLKVSIGPCLNLLDPGPRHLRYDET
jgi:hypothetical protein